MSVDRKLWILDEMGYPGLLSFLIFFFPPFSLTSSQRNPLTNSQECLSIFVVKVVKIFPKIAGKNEKYKQKTGAFFFLKIRRCPLKTVQDVQQGVDACCCIGEEPHHNLFLFWFQSRGKYTIAVSRLINPPISCAQDDLSKNLNTIANAQRKKTGSWMTQWDWVYFCFCSLWRADKLFDNLSKFLL